MEPLDDWLRTRLAPLGDWAPTALRRAAVLCPLVAGPDGDQLLFVVRPPGAQPHGGQIAFPGGKQHDGEDPLATACRECLEEIGRAPPPTAILGRLPARTSSSGFHVECVVARLPAGPLQPDPREVARLLWLPLRELRRPERWQELPPPPGAGGSQPATSPHFQAGADLLWGLTARFVRDLLARLP